MIHKLRDKTCGVIILFILLILVEYEFAEGDEKGRKREQRKLEE